MSLDSETSPSRTYSGATTCCQLTRSSMIHDPRTHQHNPNWSDKALVDNRCIRTLILGWHHPGCSKIRQIQALWSLRYPTHPINTGSSITYPPIFQSPYIKEAINAPWCASIRSFTYLGIHKDSIRSKIVMYHLGIIHELHSFSHLQQSFLNLCWYACMDKMYIPSTHSSFTIYLKLIDFICGIRSRRWVAVFHLEQVW